jgi:anti-sigma factor RsiW
MNCRATTPLLEAFSDGELSPEKVLEVEQHLSECQSCVSRVRLGQALRRSVRHQARSNTEPSDAFRARLASAINAVHQREQDVQVLEQQVERGRMLSWRTILPVAAAAAFTLFWAANAKQEPARTSARGADLVHQPTVDDLIEDLVNHHVGNRPEVTSASLLPEIERQVGVPVRVPSLKQYGANWEGGSVVPFHNQRAASLRYKLDGHRMTLYVFEPRRIPFEKRLERRQVGDEQVYVGSSRGYSIGASDAHGVGYAIASDLNERETAELVAALY